jgi:hypothetical protein
MRATQKNCHRQLESVICESDLGFELLDMLAQANIDFRRLPPEELQNLMAKSRTSATNNQPRMLAMAMA